MNAIATNISNGVVSLPQGVSIAPGESATVFICFDILLSIAQEGGGFDITMPPPAGMDGEWLKQWNNLINLLQLFGDGVITVELPGFGGDGLKMKAKATPLTFVNPFVRKIK